MEGSNGGKASPRQTVQKRGVSNRFRPMSSVKKKIVNEQADRTGPPTRALEHNRDGNTLEKNRDRKGGGNRKRHTILKNEISHRESHSGQRVKS